MNRSLRLTRRAEESLAQIARWTIESFGTAQADRYEMDLLDRCREICEGRALSRSCAVLAEDAADLRFTRAGEHFLVFLDDPEEVVIVDILHSRSDLPRHVAALGQAKGVRGN
ncbi:type II toxin-antitoxin system RelE/ParE family toxin [Palleronia sp. LCG004]|uniref:type II toxin-antitoxin system RelE/ParE family toxin n=1 Tax=Palleronia sp. LCG004 TaxID=3079304 RepID=UPI0029427968|nr:type II toxin-antitoxin system RelE/ParE family toxin [Palleronia sp. LCG004]WOI58047.1 type II toxin-antitoxin system RelE/ParE family toxin [Palleronia sp. LCG004]